MNNAKESLSLVSSADQKNQVLLEILLYYTKSSPTKIVKSSPTLWKLTQSQEKRQKPFTEGAISELRSGRKKGSLNKFTTLKRAFVNAFQQMGGEAGLVTWAQNSKSRQTEFFKLLGKMLPRGI